MMAIFGLNAQLYTAASYICVGVIYSARVHTVTWISNKTYQKKAETRDIHTAEWHTVRQCLPEH